MKTVKSILFNALLATIPFLIICGLPLTALKVCAETTEIEFNTDVDIKPGDTSYVFRSDKPGNIEIVFETTGNSNDLVYIYLSKSGSRIRSYLASLNDNTWKIYQMNIEPGVDYSISFQFMNRDEITDDKFTLRINYSEEVDETCEHEDNDSRELANPITYGVTYYGDLYTSDKDWYKFSIPEAGYISIGYRASYCYADVNVCDDNGNSLICAFNWDPETQRYKSDLIYLEPGIYCFAIEYSDKNNNPYTRHSPEPYRYPSYAFSIDFTALSRASWTVMYRLYNPNSGEHFWTGSIEERDDLVKAGWNYEGHGWNAPVEEGEPVYRFYNATLGDHHYTMDPEEIAYLNAADGWTCEDVCWNSASEETGVPLYRLYNPHAYADGTAGAHHYTMSDTERAHLIYAGWIDEGIGWYAEKE